MKSFLLENQVDHSDQLYDNNNKWCNELLLIQSCQLGNILNNQANIENMAPNFHQVELDPYNIELSSETKQTKKISQTTLPENKEKPLFQKRVKVGGCTCKKTSCLKSYCQCYSKNKMCSQSCCCLDCRNNQNHKLHIQNSRKKKQKLSNKSGHQCQCSKTKCQKKYCQCFNSGYTCGVHCKCVDCLNVQKNTNEDNNQQSAS